VAQYFYFVISEFMLGYKGKRESLCAERRERVARLSGGIAAEDGEEEIVDEGELKVYPGWCRYFNILDLCYFATRPHFADEMERQLEEFMKNRLRTFFTERMLFFVDKIVEMHERDRHKVCTALCHLVFVV
jgi:hypothetical protein